MPKPPADRRAISRGSLSVLLLLGLGIGMPGAAQSPQPRDLTQFSLEDLMNVQVTSVSKKEQKLAKTAAAIFVINQEDIRRSGATTIPDLLRMVPGVDVARVDHSNWAIGIRGFSNVFSNKVLVLIDGRSVYHPAFSGVLWYAFDVPLEQIDRIEVIRGPGGTVWGANAMNGVINVITKSAKTTLGGLVVAGGGSKQQAEGLFQFGGKAGKNGFYRAFGRYSNIGDSDPATFAQPADSRRFGEAGFRFDWDVSPRDLLTVQGQYRRVDGGETMTGVVPQNPPVMATSAQALSDEDGNILGRWTRTFSPGSNISVQAYFDKTDVFDKGVHDYVSIENLEFQHHLNIGKRNDLVWGLSYRAAANRFAGNSVLTINPARRTDSLFAAFLQDEISLTPTLSLTLGSKFEHNTYTGFESEPSAQLVWTPDARNTLWASASRAIRQPANIDTGLQSVSSVIALQGAFGLVTVFGNPNAKVEQLRDLEIGYRGQISRRVSVDVAGFLSFYKHLETTEPQSSLFVFSPGPPHLQIPFIFDYQAHARSYGAEAFGTWTVSDRWKFSTGVSLLNLSVKRDPSSQDAVIEQLPGNSPRRSFQIRSFFNPRRRLEWDQTVGYTGRLAQGPIPGYLRLDTRLGWRMGESLEMSIVGQNLLESRHAEFPDSQLIDHMLDQRSVFGKITWRF
jgi:iron complex outermembrane receptor protein